MKRVFVIGLLIFVLLIAGCYGTPSAPSQPAVEPTGEVKEFSMTAFSFGYEPSTINANVGDTVRITITNNDVGHTFTINELGVNERLGAGSTKTVEFVASQTGTFAFYCAVPGHRPSGMEGQIVIS